MSGWLIVHITKWQSSSSSASVAPLPGSCLAACMTDLTLDLLVCLSWGLIAKSFHSLQSLSVSCSHVILGLPGPCFSTSASVAPLPGSCLAACMTDLTLNLLVCLSWGSIAKSFHSLQSLSVSCSHVILGLPGPCFSTTYMPNAVLNAPVECSTCPYQQTLLSFRMRSRDSMPSRASSSLDLVVTMSCSLTLQICLIIALPFLYRQAKSHWHGALCYTHKSCTITKTCLYNSDPLKPHFYIVKLGFTGVYIIFLISAQNIDCGYSLEPPVYFFFE